MRDKITTVAVLIGLLGGGATLYADESDETESQTSSVTGGGGATSTSSEESEAVSSETANADKKSASSAAEKLDNIVVSATGYEHNIIDAPASMYVITREQLENRSFNDLTEVLKNVPGVFVEGGSVFKDISIRGMGSGYTLYLVDGKPMSGNEAHSPNGMSGGIATNALPPVSMIERIEIVRGPMSSLYGSEAMGGVINIITKKTPSEWSGSVKGEYTKSFNDISEDGFQASVNLAGPVIKDLLSLQTYGSILGVDESNVIGGGKSLSSNPEFDSRQFGSKATLAINKENSVWASYDYTKQRRLTIPGKSVAATGTNQASESIAIKQTASAGHDLKLDDFTLNTYVQNAVSKNPSRGDGIDYEVLTVNTQGTYFFETNILSVGGQYKKEELDDRATNGLPAVANPSNIMKRWSYALFAEDEWNILDDLALTGGVRFNDSEGFGTHVDPRVYLVYNLTDGITLKGGVSSGYRAPALRQYAVDFGGVTGGGSCPASNPCITAGNPDLEPETSLSYEVSAAYNNKEIGLGASVTAHRADYKDKIVLMNLCDSGGADNCTYGAYNAYRSVARYENVDKAVIEGFEVTLNYDLASIVSLGTTYTYTNSEQKTGSLKGKPISGTSKNMFNANVNFDITEWFSLWGQYNHVGKQKSYNYGRVTTSISETENKGYATADVGAVVRLKDNLKFLAGVYNVADKEVTNSTHGRFIDGRRLIVGLNADF
ncbi:MAG: TonB-dependent receptor, partial [Helicobacteraceae bacterium]|jgi:outer membrane receptor for ferrienterochelin and colicins|nr:TonB-dependent receptor [Helicobacteraceae bacterium]